MRRGRATRRSFGIALGLVGAVSIAPTVGSGATATPPGLVYGGETPQFEVVTAEVSAARNRVTKFVFGWSADCIPGPAATPTTPNFTAWTEYRGGYPINRAGRWSKNFTSRRVEAGVVQEFAYRLAGTRTSLNMNGTIRVTMVEKDAAGQIIRTCDSQPVRYTALEKLRYGGLTVGQRLPALVRLNPASTRVQRIRWDWTGTCTPGPAAKPETATTHFEADFVDGPLVIRPNKTFAADLVYDPTANPTTGLSRVYTAKVVGRRVNRTIVGTLTAGFTETEIATGAIVRTCTSGPVKFNTKD